MGTVFGKNTTSSSITVAGHKVYYIDSTDAEIVEVEKQGGGGSTASDDTTGTISGVTLPTAHSYAGVSFDSLRYYVKGTVSNTGTASTAFGLNNTFFYGTITWEDSSLGDLTDKIATNSPSNDYRVKQTVFRIIFITYDSISGYHPWDDGDDSAATNNNQISDYSYNNGVHSITFWADGVNWIGGSVYLGRIQFRYLDGTTTFNNLSAFDLVNVSGGSLLKDTSTDRYDMYNAWGGNITLHALYGSAETIRRNAFKYSLSGTPYWYVIDGEHDTWTDDLSAWGYSEVQPVETLPTVTTEGDFGSYNWAYAGGSGTTLTSGATARVYDNYSSGSSVLLDSSKVYAPYGWLYYDNSSVSYLSGVFSITDDSEYLAVKNDSGESKHLYAIRVAVCSSNQATVVTVYNSSNVAYNAFKFTANNTDYYYVLDGTQTDWTDDLSSIGYSLYLKAWFTSDKSGKSIDTSYPGNGGLLYDSQGAFIAFQSGSTYTTVAVYNTSQQAVSGIDSSNFTLEDNGGGYLSFKNRSSKAPTALYVEYTVS